MMHQEVINIRKGVKQLVENGVNTVPKKYILPPSDRPATNNSQDTNMANHNLHLPIIDFSDLLGPNRPQVVNHGISDDVMNSMMDVSGRFFDLPFEERAKYMTADMRAAALVHASVHCQKKLFVDWIPATNLEDATAKENPNAYKATWKLLEGADGILVPGGFGDRGVQAKIIAAKYTRENRISFINIDLLIFKKWEHKLEAIF
ncbi:Non-heme dioxygenase N-terminal domain [Sesbania bispinosa]|nr:Non-heme dioxygenase N-terminal domain [Sesbania bispinosa]